MKNQFITDLCIKTVGEDDEQEKWVLTAPLIFESKRLGCPIIVPSGYHTDLASTPRLPLVYWLFGNTARKAAVLHDFLYGTAMVTRSMADAIMRDAAEATNVSWLRRWGMWAAVRVFGGQFYAEQAN